MATKNVKKTKALGRGLAALIPDNKGSAKTRPVQKVATALAVEKEDIGPNNRVLEVPIEEVSPMKGQPRYQFNPQKLNELAESIREKGILQPVLVHDTGDGYQLIAGERRWRASQIAGLKKIPVLVKDVGKSEAFQLALIENIQREDLNPIEVGRAYKRLMEEFKMTQASVAERVGKDRTSVANYLRILTLPPHIMSKVEDKTLSFGHARTIAGLSGEQLSKLDTYKLVAGQYSVRELERLVSKMKSGARKVNPDGSDMRRGESAQIKFLRRQLERHLGLKVQLKDNKGKGELKISYNSLDELDGLLQLLGINE